MRIKLKPSILISNDEDGKYKLFAPDDTKIERQIDTYQRHFSGTASIVSTGTEALSLGDLGTAKGLWLSVNADCLVTINGGTPIQLRRASGAAGDDKAGLMLEADITALSVTAQATAVDVIYAVWGDPVE
jgi:hypothetical protein